MVFQLHLVFKHISKEANIGTYISSGSSHRKVVLGIL